MLKGLADLLDWIFRPINAMFPVGTGAAPPVQGGNVVVGIAPGSKLSSSQVAEIRKLVDRLPVWAEMGAPSLLEKLSVPSPSYSTPTGPAVIPKSDNEVRKPLNLEEAAWRASS